VPLDITLNTFTVVDANGNPLVDVARANYVAMKRVLGVSSDAFDNSGAFLRNRRFRTATSSTG